MPLLCVHLLLDPCREPVLRLPAGCGAAWAVGCAVYRCAYCEGAGCAASQVAGACGWSGQAGAACWWWGCWPERASEKSPLC